MLEEAQGAHGLLLESLWGLLQPHQPDPLMRPKIGFQKRDFTSKPVKQVPVHSPGPFMVEESPSGLFYIYDVAVAVVAGCWSADNARWICAAMNGAWNSEENIRNLAAPLPPYRRVP